MSVLFIAPSQFSIGELHNAICLARQLEESGTSTFFLTSANHIEYALNSKVNAKALSKKVRQTKIIKETVLEKEIQAIIIADYHNLDLESPLIDLDYILTLGVPVATIDSLCFGPDERVLYNQLFKGSKSRARNKFAVEIRKIPESMKIIRTCPINNPRYESERVLPVTLYTQTLELETDKKEAVKKSFGCKHPEDKLVMVSKSAWANLLVKMRLMETATHMNAAYNYEYFIQELLIEYLGVQEINANIIIIGVAPEAGFVATNPEEKVQFVTLPFLDLEEYEDILFSVDLFITDNITSASMAKALFAHVPVLSLMNSKVSTTAEGKLELPTEWETNRLDEILTKWLSVMSNGIYPFLTYPNGWVEELEPLLKGNPWYEVIDTSEIFDIQHTGQKIHQLLYCEETKKQTRVKQTAYIQEIIQLNKADKMLEFLMEKENPRRERLLK